MEAVLEKANTDLKLKEFCDPVRYNPEKIAFDKETPKIIIFSVTPEEEEKMTSLLNNKTSQVFCKFWMDVGKKCERKKMQDSGERLTVKDVFNEVYPRTATFWQGFIKKVVDGTVLLKTLDYGFKELYPQWDMIEKELVFMFPSKDDPRIQQRLVQIRRYSTIAQYEKGAWVILDAKKRLDLTGDFSILEQIIGAVS